MNKNFIKKAMKLLLVVFSMTMLYCIPADAAASTSVKALKVGKTYNIKDTSNVVSTKPAVASATKKNSKAYTISALKKGTSTLKVYNSKGKVSEKVYLLVYNDKSFKYDTDPLTLTSGSSKKVAASVQSGCTVKYTSSNKNVAKVNQNGKIIAVSKGNATISAKVFYKGTRIKTLKKPVTVTQKKETESASKNTDSSSGSSSSSTSSSAETDARLERSSQYLMSKESVTVDKGKSVTIYCTMSIYGSVSFTTDTFEWKCSDTSVVSIKASDNECTITGKSVGDATVTCVVNGVVPYTCKVHATSENEITVNGVTFDLNNFPKSTEVANSECLSVIPQSDINPADITYVIANGKAELLCDYTTPDLYNSSQEQYTFEYYVSDWNNMIAYVHTSYDPSMYLEYRCEIYPQLRTGSFPVSVYYQGTLLRTCTVSITTTSKTTEYWRAWADEIEAKAWTNTMTVTEKLSAIEDYIRANYSYVEDGVWCNHGAAALLFAARDLGLIARYRFTNDGIVNNNYSVSNHDVYYHNGMVTIGGHVCTVITIDGKDYIYQTEGYH